MKLSEISRIKEILINYYNNSKMLVWIYDKDMQLVFTNFTNAILLHLMDAMTPIAEQYKAEASYKDYMKLYGNANEAYLCFTYAQDRRNTFTVVIGPGLLTYPSEQIWDDFIFSKHVWSNQKDECLKLIPICTLEAFLLNCRFIMQIFGIYHLNPLQIADSLPMTNYYYEETEKYDYMSGGVKSDFYSVKQSHEIEEMISYYIRSGQAEYVDEILTHKDQISLLLPAESHKDNFIYAISLLSIARNAAITGGMRQEAAYSLFRSYSIQVQSCRQSLEFYRLIHNALCAFAEGVQSVSVKMLDWYSDTIKGCIQAIHNHLPGKVTVEELADEVHLSPKYLSSLFVKETGTSITQFVIKERIEHAKHLLETTDLSYLEISNILEFSSQSHFTQTFKKQTACTPKEYRLRNRKNVIYLE